jgi:methionyl-tRNA formyltransferase
VPSSIESQGAGKIISSEKNELIIGGIDKCVSIKELARESKKRMTYKNFFNGSKNFFLKNEIFE